MLQILLNCVNWLVDIVLPVLIRGNHWWCSKVWRYYACNVRAHEALHEFTNQIPTVGRYYTWSIFNLGKLENCEKRKRWKLCVHTSTRTPLNVWLIETLPSLITKSPSSKRGPLDSICNRPSVKCCHGFNERKFTFVCFFEVYAGVILRMSKSNNESATKAICFVPVSSMENTEAGCSELCRRWTIFGETENPN